MKHPIERDLPVIDFLRAYHRHSVENLEILRPFFQKNQSFFLVGNHSFNLFDPGLLYHSIYRKYRRTLRVVGQFDIFHKIGLLKEFVKPYGLVAHDDFRRIYTLTSRGKSLLIYPGGIDEAMLRNYQKEPYTLIWQKRPGLAKLAIRYKIPIIFVAGIGIDEMVFQSNHAKMPALLTEFIKGRGNYLSQSSQWFWNVPFSAPVKITHVITEPIQLTATPSQLKNKDFIEQTLQQLQSTCQSRLDRELVKHSSGMYDPLDWSMRKTQKILRRFNF